MGLASCVPCSLQQCLFWGTPGPAEPAESPLGLLSLTEQRELGRECGLTAAVFPAMSGVSAEQSASASGEERAEGTGLVPEAVPSVLWSYPPSFPSSVSCKTPLCFSHPRLSAASWNPNPPQWELIFPKYNCLGLGDHDIDKE